LQNGIGLYRFKYLWGERNYVGVVAQEVATIVPDAVVKGADGYLRVNYTHLGLNLQTWEEWTHDQSSVWLIGARDREKTRTAALRA
jgi:hypothetical protein